MSTQMTITVPTGKPGQLAAFRIEFSTAEFDQVIDQVSACSSPKHVADLEESGLIKVIG